MADKQTVEEIKKLVRGLKLEHYNLLHKHGYADFKLDSETEESKGYGEDEKWLEDVYVTAFNQLLIKERLDERKMAMVRTKNYTKDEIDLMIKVGIAYPADIERIAELENQLGEKS